MTDTSSTATAPLSASQAGALLQSGWRPWIGWVLLFVVIEQFALKPIADWVAMAIFHKPPFPAIDMDGLVFLASLAGVLVVSRTFEKINNAD